MDKDDVAEVLSDIGRILALQDANQFKVRAYEDAARTIGSLSQDLHELVENNELGDLEGIGEALAEKISELVRTGSLAYYEDLKEDVPDGVLAMMEIPGLGPRKVESLWKELEVTTLDELETAAEQEKVQELDGFGAKTEQNILDGIQHLKTYRQRYRINRARKSAEPFLEFLEDLDEVERVKPCGSLRRHSETIGDVDILASVEESRREQVMDQYVNHSDVHDVISQGDTKSSIRTDDGIQVDLRLVTDDQFPFALHYFTGSKEHNVAMRSLAIDQGLKLNEYGLFRTNDEAEDEKDEQQEGIACDTEEELFEALGLHFIPPELREDMGEIEHANEEPIPELVTAEDIEGTFHAHTTRSDGKHELREMVEACRERNLSYLGISDHSQSAKYAGGLTEAEIKEQWEEIDSVQEDVSDVRIFKGIESDIRSDGSLDYEDDLLAGFDFVIASVHQQFQLSEDEQTDRLVRAVSNEYTTMLGHPTGRLLLEREGYDLDMERVIEAAAEHDTAIEINANPRRLDLDWRHAQLAQEHGVLTSINPDAHSTAGIDHMRWGAGIARKGWWTRDQVINTWSRSKVEEFLRV